MLTSTADIMREHLLVAGWARAREHELYLSGEWWINHNDDERATALSLSDAYIEQREREDK